MRQSAQISLGYRSGIAHIILIGAVAVIGLVVLGLASGGLKGSFKISKTGSQQETGTENTSAGSQKAAQEKPSPSPQTPTLSKTYTNNVLKMQINYPQEWTVNQTNSGANIYAPSTDVTSSAKSDAVLIVTSSPLGTLKGLQLATIADVMKNQMGTFLPGATVASTSTTKIGTQEAYVYYLDYRNNGQNYPSVFYLLTNDENLYGIITSVSEAKRGTYEAILKAAVDTFKIL